MRAASVRALAGGADWLAQPNPATGQPLTTQDFADIYAWLKTQTE